jgi:hypothetical protein
MYRCFFLKLSLDHSRKVEPDGDGSGCLCGQGSRRFTTKLQSSCTRIPTMPFIYTGAPLSKKAIQSNEYRQRDISSMTTGDLHKLSHIGIPTASQVAYDGYLSNLPAFLHATAIQGRVSCSAKFYRSNLNHELLLPLPLPPLGFTPEIPLRNEQEKNQFMMKIGNDVRAHRFGQRDIYIIDRPTPSVVMNLPLDDLDYDAPTPDNCTNLTGIFSLLSTLKILTLFVATHTYPAFQSPDGSNQYSQDMEVCVLGAGSQPVDRLRVGGLREEYKARRVRVQELDASVDRLVEFEGDEYTFGRGDDLVLVAIPAPLRPSINYGSLSQTPNLPGYGTFL